MEVEAVIAAFLGLENKTHIHVIILTDSESMLRKVKIGMLREAWQASLGRSWVVSILWIVSPGHAGVVGNEQACRLAGSAPLGGEVIHDKAEGVKPFGNKQQNQ
ncbi:unnamed protein product [Candidula unifasciata]|uniref:RNase H type-1 domain-containing protein n=1 Tax=Candidula unifasciata TaxID=100452 RepID=A0A8S3YLF0_9EUPU|nr:unnamed protein product [Candidula unifasciata]